MLKKNLISLTKKEIITEIVKLNRKSYTYSFDFAYKLYPDTP